MRSSIFLSSLLSTVVSACLYPRAPYTNSTYSYSGITGPLGWHNIAGNELCGNGKNQSPINVSPNRGVAQAEKLQLNFPKFSTEFNVINNGQTVDFTPADNRTYTSILEGQEYTLVGFHFHTPSEHLFLDESYPLEVHFVHASNTPKKNLAVVGVFFDMRYDWGDSLLCSTTTALSRVGTAGTETKLSDINFKSIMNVTSESRVWTYDGSLTTPPCTEGVTWYVVEDSLPMSPAQYQKWKEVMKFNSRITQNLPGEENLIAAAGKKPIA